MGYLYGTLGLGGLKVGQEICELSWRKAETWISGREFKISIDKYWETSGQHKKSSFFDL